MHSTSFDVLLLSLFFMSFRDMHSASELLTAKSSVTGMHTFAEANFNINTNLCYSNKSITIASQHAILHIVSELILTSDTLWTQYSILSSVNHLHLSQMLYIHNKTSIASIHSLISSLNSNQSIVFKRLKSQIYNKTSVDLNYVHISANYIQESVHANDVKMLSVSSKNGNISKHDSLWLATATEREYFYLICGVVLILCWSICCITILLCYHDKNKTRRKEIELELEKMKQKNALNNSQVSLHRDNMSSLNHMHPMSVGAVSIITNNSNSKQSDTNLSRDSLHKHQQNNHNIMSQPVHMRRAQSMDFHQIHRNNMMNLPHSYNMYRMHNNRYDLEQNVAPSANLAKFRKRHARKTRNKYVTAKEKIMHEHHKDDMELAGILSSDNDNDIDDLYGITPKKEKEGYWTNGVDVI